MEATREVSSRNIVAAVASGAALVGGLAGGTGVPMLLFRMVLFPIVLLPKVPFPVVMLLVMGRGGTWAWTFAPERAMSSMAASTASEAEAETDFIFGVEVVAQK